MSDIGTQTDRVPEAQPLTYADAVILAWSQACELPAESLSTLGADVQARALHGIAVYVLRHDLEMSVEDVAAKIKVPTTYVRLLTVEINRTFAGKATVVPIKYKLARTREIAKELMAAQRKNRLIEPVRIVAEATLTTPERKRRGGRRAAPLIPIDDAVGLAVLEKICPLFLTLPDEIRGPNRSMRREAKWARMTAMAIFYNVIKPAATIPAIAQYFGMGGSTVYNALALVEGAANSRRAHMYRHAIAAACKLFGSSAGALRRHQRTVGPRQRSDPV